ncbi:tetratricopeptide repeat protein [Candidatus Methylospira mobilis]|uniref:O-linked N-acetylglucosamine transferase family protein n=1 Tax=Candidatus Methylospira mobilis TaxID=1808979 RepID=UPI0028E7BC6D|nr:tetratricopeptide repeat protein [Candidatus Methylospira mobilis]WNV05392.1 tetratricopeptide repeat protein [Candidatus Methylospira mobilis]
MSKRSTRRSGITSKAGTAFPGRKPGSLDAEFQRGLLLHQQGKTSAAVAIYQNILKHQPQHADALHYYGVVHYQNGNPQLALEWIEKALAVRHGNPEALSNQGITLHALQRYEEAVAAYRKSLQLRPAQASVLYNCGNALKEMLRLDEALGCFDAALHLQPDYADAHFNRAHTLKELKRYHEALEAYKQVLRLLPQCVEALYNQGDTLQQMRQYEEALAVYEDALRKRPGDADACHHNRAHALHALKRYDEALAAFDAAIKIHPDDSAVHNNRGNTLKELKRFDAALEAYDRALHLSPGFVEALDNRGNILHELNRYHDALIAHDAALALRPDYADAHNNRGNTLRALKRYDEALAAFEAALTLNPMLVEAHSNRSYTYFELQKHDEALAACEAALRLQPDQPDALNSRANVHFALRDYEQALLGFDAVMQIRADYEEVAGMRLHSAMHLCEWDNLERFKDHVFDLLDEGKLPSSPFPLLAVDASLQQQKLCAQRYSRQRYPEWANDCTAPGTIAETHDSILGSTPGKIRIAYFSADYFDHPTSHLIAELIEKHDRTRFEIIGYCYWKSPDDGMRQRIIKAFDQFYSVNDLSDYEIAMHARSNAIDIAIDLKGHTQYARLGIFAHRAAPVQIHYLGYPGTLGAPFIDYLIADPILIPQQHQRFYTEKIIYLPDSYQANDSNKIISERVYTRSGLGLPENGFVFCCFNNNYKITPDVFNIWMRLLHQKQGSVLWLLESSPAARKNLEKSAQKNGIAVDRLVFAPRMQLSEHLARHAQADLFLDTFHYNAHTTTSDALWAGLPVITKLGQTFAGRVAASLLYAVGLPELVMPDAIAYEQMALTLAEHPEKLFTLKIQLENNRLSRPLFDTPRFVRNLEQAYIEVSGKS